MGLTGKLQELIFRIRKGIVRRVEQHIEVAQIFVVEHGVQAGLARHARRAGHARHGGRRVGPDRTAGVDGLVVVGTAGWKGEGGHFAFGAVIVDQVVVITVVVQFLLRGQRHVSRADS